ncbi:MAG TPA: DUF4912 domain-containing protein [Blastocatellia bacterium]|nr:DUF4912 domain-containing protein [Blastocatellia bacterium]HMV81690.1 DUF4912 domain-containing protein [Blastocatellia bacterium]HMY74666.1 DUF4912 domain-containing protein [Blastocatellia bacterium]HMZ17221.1 DUF4912 domain-containing protein [Blastocatellia bacterium]HNG29648.1 DUF4912 domain-containing protein [Blastocatellia bacterium]
MPFFFDLSSLVPLVERNPFQPLVVPDALEKQLAADAAAETAEAEPDAAAEPIVDTGLPIPAHYDFDMMRAIVQDPFRLFVYWQLKDNPFDRLRKMFPAADAGSFHTALKLVDETTNISVFFNAAYAREYWFSVFPDRSYRVELGVRSPQYGFIKLLNSQTVRTPRGGPSDQAAPEEEYAIKADEFVSVLRESHLVPERAFTVDGLLPRTDAAPAEARNAVWEALPPSFRRTMTAISDIQAGRDYERWWERLDQEDLAGMVKEFLRTVAEMGDGELGYMLLLRYLPEVLRRAVLAEVQGEAGPVEQQKIELQIDKPITLYLAERLGQAASEMNVKSSSDNVPQLPGGGYAPAQPAGQAHWLPSMSFPA